MLIVVDLDDTLLNSNLRISEYNKKVLSEIKKNGHKIMISTLRSYKRCQQFASEINADYISCFLGNLCLDKNGKLLKNNALNIKDFSSVIKDFKKIYNCWIGFETEKLSIIANKEIARKYDGVEFIEEEKILDILNNNNVYKISFSCNNDELIVNKYIELANKHNCDYKFSKGFRYCDLIPRQTEKVNTLKLFKSHHPNEKIIVFGDDKTDVESIKFADIGVAMQNSGDEVKEVANFIALSNDEDGVGKFLEHITKVIN